MSDKRYRGLEMLMRMFTRMVYVGITVVATGLIVGVFLRGAAEAVVISACAGGGGMMVFAGLRGQKRSRIALVRLRGDDIGA
jgi:hypothetical protein